MNTLDCPICLSHKTIGVAATIPETKKVIVAWHCLKCETIFYEDERVTVIAPGPEFQGENTENN